VFRELIHCSGTALLRRHRDPQVDCLDLAVGNVVNVVAVDVYPHSSPVADSGVITSIPRLAPAVKFNEDTDASDDQPEER
jgi:hypothetical protein